MPADTALLNDVLEVVVWVREQLARLSASRETTIPKAEVEEMLEDVVCRCARLMSSMISSPLTGRMFIAPDISLTQDMCERSLTESLIVGMPPLPRAVPNLEARA